MADWTAIPEEVRKELVERLDMALSIGTTYDLCVSLLDELNPPPLSDAEKLEAIREAMDVETLRFDPMPILGKIRAILEGRRP